VGVIGIEIALFGATLSICGLWSREFVGFVYSRGIFTRRIWR